MFLHRPALGTPGSRRSACAFPIRELRLEGSQGEPRWTVRGQEVWEPQFSLLLQGRSLAIHGREDTSLEWINRGLSDLTLMKGETQDTTYKRSHHTRVRRKGEQNLCF